MTLTRRALGAGLGAAALLPAAPRIGRAAISSRPLRLVLSQELAVLDPIISTNNATRSFGYMVFDTLIAMDARGGYRPQMLEGWDSDADGMRWRFRLRPGLRWHDGAPVMAADCVASLRRWGRRDGLGQQLLAATGALRAEDAASFTLELARPFGFVVEALGKPGTVVPFMMPERLAATDPAKPVPEIVGSGPYTFRREDWRQGDRAVFRRNADYVPREEPADGLAGGKRVFFESVEFVSIPDPATKVAALQAGEIDMLEFVPPDFIPVLRADRGVRVVRPAGGMGQYMPFVSLNHAQPPFNDIAVRRAAQAAIDQDEITAGTGLPDDMRLRDCTSIYTCDSPATIAADTPALRERGTAHAKALLAQSGYKGERVVFLHPTDSTILNPVASVAIAQLRAAGFNVEEWASDWAAVAQRRLSREPVERGGWSAVTVVWPGIDLFNPLVNSVAVYDCRDYPGWFCDSEQKTLLDRYAAQPAGPERDALAAAIQRRFHENVNFIIAGQVAIPQAWRAELTDGVPFAFPVPWNLRRAAP